MAAGSFLFENKLRPGCYIQLKGVPKASANMSERGTVVILMNADSGGLLTEISANDILTGGSSAKGFPLSMFTDTKSILNYVYPYVNKLLIGRLNFGGTKASAAVLSKTIPASVASATQSGVTITAKQAGAAGNGISVSFAGDSPNYDTATVVVSNGGSSWTFSNQTTVAALNSEAMADPTCPVTFGGSGSLPFPETPVSATLSGGADESSEPSLTARAKYDGIMGNKLSVIIVAEENGEGKYRGQGFFVRTSLDGGLVDEQNVKLPSELKNNDYLQFIMAEDITALSAVAAVDLSGGTNGEESDTNLTKILGKLVGQSWNTLGFCGKDLNRGIVNTFIYNIRENKGKYRQGVLFNHGSSDYEGIISTFQAFAVDDDDVDWLETEQTDPAEEAERLAALRLRQMFAVGFVAAITAGSDVNISNTYAPVPENVIEVIPAPDEDEDVESDLKAGLLTFTHNSSNNIVIERDINTLHTYTQTRTAPFSKNRVVRCLDELSNTKVMVWEDMFIGKIDNDVTGRNLFKSQVMAIIDNLAKAGALSGNESQVIVEPGDDPDKVRSYETVRPIDAMEQLYSYVTVLG